MNGRHSGRGRRRGAAVAVAALLGAGVLAGCGSDPAPPQSSESPSTGPTPGTVTVAPDGVQEVTLVTPDGYVWLPERFTVAPGPVRLTVTSTAEQMTHNFRFVPEGGPEAIEPEIPLLAAGDSETIEFTVTTPGEHPFECTFHAQLGQVGVMTVSG